MQLRPLRSRIKTRLLKTAERIGRALKPRPPEVFENPAARIVLLMRYSILTETGQGWTMSRGYSFEAHKARLFADRRLAERLKLLKQIVLPSLAAQSLPMQAGMRELRILASALMPEIHLAALREAVAPLPWVKVHVIDTAPRYNDVFAGIAEGFARGAERIATARIDDDDALGRDFMKRLSGYVTPRFDGHVVSMGVGYFATLGEGTDRYVNFSKLNYPYSSVGLAYLRKTNADTGASLSRYRSIFDLGPHNVAFRRARSIVDDSAPLYLRTIYASQSTEGRGERQMREPVSRELVEQDVALSPEL